MPGGSKAIIIKILKSFVGEKEKGYKCPAVFEEAQGLGNVCS